MPEVFLLFRHGVEQHSARNAVLCFAVEFTVTPLLLSKQKALLKIHGLLMNSVVVV